MLGNKSKSKHYRSGGTRGGAASFDWNDVKYDVSAVHPLYSLNRTHITFFLSPT